MKCVSMAWMVSGIGALVLGMAAEACATASTPDQTLDAGGTTGGSTGCVALEACCATLSPVLAAMCTTPLDTGSDPTCSTFLSEIQMSGDCTGSYSGSGATSGASSSSSLGTTSASTASTTGSTSSTGSSSVTGATDAGASSATSSSTGSSSAISSASSSGGGGVPTTCAQANHAIGCCGTDGNVYYCTGSGSGGTTVKTKTCTSGTPCG